LRFLLPKGTSHLNQDSTLNNCIVTTSWDDGQLLDLKLSSLLLKYGLKGTFFMPRVWDNHKVDPDLVHGLSENFEIGAHSLSHSNLTSLPLKDAANEIQGSKEWLEELLHHEIEMFSYPIGKYNNDILKLVKMAGFKGARSLDFQIALSTDPFHLGVGPQASNGSPIIRLKGALKSNFSIKGLSNWSVNAKFLFDHILQKGGIWHLWGHSWEIEKNNDWQKLEDVLSYVSNRPGVAYLENREVRKIMSGSSINCLHI